MITIKKTNDDAQERQYEIQTDGEVAFVDPSYMSPGHAKAWRRRASFRFEISGTWHVKVEPMVDVPDHRNGALIAFKDRTDPKAGEWHEVTEVFVDSGLMSLFPTGRGPLEDLGEYFEDLKKATEGEGPMTLLTEVQETLVCSAGIGDGAYMVLVRRNASDEIDGVMVDLTPDELHRSMVYGPRR